MRVACRCGRVRYAVRGEAIHRAYCHCLHCRQATGAPVAALAGFRDADIVVEGERPAVYSAVEGVERLFCATCGSPIGYRDVRLPGETYFAIGAIDEAAALAPDRHSYAAERLPWFATTDDGPRFPATSRPRD